jgi:hypothetical protein
VSFPFFFSFFLSFFLGSSQERVGRGGCVVQKEEERSRASGGLGFGCEMKIRRNGIWCMDGICK